MKNPFLSQKYVALALIKSKTQIFGESFITTSELSQFTMFMQQEFNERELGIAIINGLGTGDFNVKGGIVTATDRCCYDLFQIPKEILDILTDKSLTLKFLMEFENERLEVLKGLQRVKTMQKRQNVVSYVTKSI